MPMVSANPASPGNENVACMKAMVPINKIMLAIRAMTATMPANR